MNTMTTEQPVATPTMRRFYHRYIHYVTGIGNGSRAHVGIACSVTMRQYCPGLQKRIREREELFYQLSLYGRNTRSREDCGDIYAQGLIDRSALILTQRVDSPRTLRIKLQTYRLLCKAPLWTCKQAKVVASAVPMRPHVASKVFLIELRIFKREKGHAWCLYRPTKGLIGVTVP